MKKKGVEENGKRIWSEKEGGEEKRVEKRNEMRLEVRK